ncbi:MAG: hypothetical protein HOO67_01940 [Candidatus Peribacteraceae bacterium]|nr:hypothetical protein [Candidatus Peribacteraceae bacterium]
MSLENIYSHLFDASAKESPQADEVATAAQNSHKNLFGALWMQGNGTIKIPDVDFETAESKSGQ